MKYSIIEYVWCHKNSFRSKTRVLENFNLVSKDDSKNNLQMIELPSWEAYSDDKSITLFPILTIYCPFRSGGLITLCDTEIDGQKSSRYDAVNVFKKFKNGAIFSFEQEYYLEDGEDKYVKPNISEIHASYCLRSGIRISEFYFNNDTNKWIYKIYPYNNHWASDFFILSKFILFKICNDHGIRVNFTDPDLKCIISLSTKEMREEGGYDHILKAIDKIAESYDEKLDWSVGDETAMINVSRHTYESKCGYFEDRRNKGYVDPYVATSSLLSIVSG